MRGHDEECMCDPCMDRSMTEALLANGMDPGKYVQRGTVTAVRTRYATPGTTAGYGTVRKLSDKQVRYIKRLLAERDTSALVRLPGSENIEKMSLRGARDLIDRLLKCPELPEDKKPGASDKMLSYAKTLLETRVSPPEYAMALDLINSGDKLTFKAVKKIIEALKDAPWKPRPARPDAASAVELTEGLYELPDGTIYRLKTAQRSKRMFAAKAEFIDGFVRFEYERGGMNRVKPEHKMSLERADELSLKFAQCMCCDRELSNKVSVALGIGPICRAKYFS